ncbi:DNA sulfur modification protein DndD [Aeromonas veronii]|uniref:DNA sulfur modification protein DndD n=1 Tax=Aeromonas veronii TaxID=654 RepID=UPI001F18DB69|nr:DNA sulfur modification protein DndD [Aeromonas veronii]MCF5856323.1 DNA sulfur modification protein DndD [Aeromonas veronii]
MIFEQLVLENFGIYKGRHEVDLDSPDHKRPIILFGALNGGGKTTFLDALQLALYGKHAKCSNRGRLSYPAYLEQAINRYAPEKKASLSLRFRHTILGKDHTYEINRAWEKEADKECKEVVVVSHNGHPDALLSEHWGEFINEFIPQSLSELFFFDGEKIEHLADPARSANLVKTGIESLLGLELLSQLNIDLDVLKKRGQNQLLDPKQKVKLEEAETRLAAFLEAQNTLQNNLIDIDDQILDREAEVAYWRQQLKDNGAHLLHKKDEISRQQVEITTKIDGINSELIKLAAGSLPLKLVSSLIEQTKSQLYKEDEIKRYHIARALLINQENKIFGLLNERGTAHNVIQSLQTELSKEREASDQLYSEPCYLNSSPAIFDGLAERLAAEEQEASSLMQEKEKLYEKLQFVERQLAAIPELASVEHIITRSVTADNDLEKAKKEKEELLLAVQKLAADITQAEMQVTSIRVQGNAIDFEQQRQQQLFSHMGKLQGIVDAFKADLIKDNIDKLQTKIISKFNQIKRKDSLITKIEIDTDTFVLTLYAQDNKPISPARLSAGERQLLAIAVLWGLADESGKELPTIIDTPMGRLDGQHRSHLIHHYFPQAASQVILLSTDEEIQGKYYKELKPYIAKEYHICFEEQHFTSTINPGYFPERNND